MSIIRCLSNPENLYIWHDICGEVAVSDNQSAWFIPYKTFCRVMSKWLDWPQDVRYRGCKIEEIQEEGPDIFRWKLSYKNRSVVMWKVTLFYVASHIKL